MRGRRKSCDAADYWLGVFRPDDTIQAAFFVRQPAIEKLTLGTTSTAVTLDTSNRSQRYGYYSIKLGHLSKARRYLKRALRLNPNSKRTQRLLADLEGGT
jgi:hypothetical protein